MTVAVFVGFQTLLILNIREFQTFARLLMIFVEFQSKFIRVWGKFMDFQSSLLSIFCRISNVVHGGCVDIFGIAQSHIISKAESLQVGARTVKYDIS